MSAVSRKDYGILGNPVLSGLCYKRINGLNDPYSVEATGHDKVSGNLVELDFSDGDVVGLSVGQRVLRGNTEGVVVSVVRAGDPEKFESVTVRFGLVLEDGSFHNEDIVLGYVELRDAQNLWFVYP